MWENIKNIFKGSYFESWMGIYFIITALVLSYNLDTTQVNDVVTVWSNIILAFIMGGIVTIRRHLDKLEKLISEK